MRIKLRSLWSPRLLKVAYCTWLFLGTFACPAHTATEDSASLETAKHSQAAQLTEQIAKELKKKPGDFRLHFALARTYEELGLYGLAEQEDAYCEKAGIAFNKYILQIFKEKLNQADYSAARMLFGYVNKQFPNDPSVMLTRAVILHQQGLITKSEETILKIIEAGHFQTGAYTYLGSLKLEQGKLKEALACFNKELATKPGFEPALVGKAVTMEQMGNHALALNILLPLYLQNPYKTSLASTTANCCLALGYFRQAAQPSLMALGTAVREQDMKQAKQRIAKFWAYLTPHQQQESIDAAANKLNSTIYNARFHFALGDTLEKLGHPKEAEQQFWQGLAIERKHERAYAHLGDIYKNSYHNYDMAKKCYQIALALTLQNEWKEREYQESLYKKIQRLDLRLQNSPQDIAFRLKRSLRRY